MGMKVGLSLSRCIRDIYEGKVDMQDVLVVIARTKCSNDDTSWHELWNGYRRREGLSNPEWIHIPEEDEPKVRAIYSNLFTEGKLHQPRQFGSHPPRLNYIWLDTFAPYEEIADNPATVKAWEKYKMLAGLTTKKRTVKDDF
jgi:hypothetical protein